MGFDRALTRALLGDVGPLRFNPKVVKVCDQCHAQHIVRYKGAGRPTAPFYCRKCVANRAEVREKLSARAQQQWADPEFAERVRASSKEIWEDPERRERMSLMHRDPQVRAATAERNRSRAYDGAAIAERMRQLWLDPAYRDNVAAQLRARQRTTADVRAQLQSLHGAAFDYSETEYVNSHTRITVRCRNCQNLQRTFVHNHIRSAACAHCQISKGHREILQFLRSLGHDPIVNDRQLIHPLELDIVLPHRQLAIEYHGLFFHSYDQLPERRLRYRHQDKALRCAAHGFRLLQFFSHEWETRPAIVQSMIAARLGAVQRLGARQCALDTDVPAVFFADSHLQGQRPAAVTIGLRHRGQIVTAMSFSRHAIYEWEIIRYATLPNYRVVGGASRLWNWFRATYRPQRVFTYADLRYAQGDVYRQLGFTPLAHTKPNYFYTDCVRLFSRQSFQKHKLARRLDHFNPALSETANCFAHGFRILYDAGHARWLWAH